MSFATPQRIRDSATKEMTVVFLFHMRIVAFLVFMHVFMESHIGSISFIFAIFCNSVCLAERFWKIQIRSLIYWPPYCQVFFVSSRLVLVFLSVVVGVLWTYVAWDHWKRQSRFTLTIDTCCIAC